MKHLFIHKKNIIVIATFLFSTLQLWSQSEFNNDSLTGKSIVNIAFNKTKRNNIVGAVNVLDAVEIMEYDRNYSLSNALIGKIPGLMGSNNNRGIGDFLFLVDGIPRDISMIKLSEVEQVSFLKDINSSILYGNHASNGIVLVTTKRGKQGKGEIQVSANCGISMLKELPQYLPSAVYMELYNEARRNDGLGAVYSDEMIEKFKYGDKFRYPDVDYFSDFFINRHSPYYNVEMEFIGGNNVITYYTNAGFRQNRGFFNFGAGKERRTNIFNIRANIDVKVNDFIKSSLDAAAIINEGYGPIGSNYFSSSANFKPHLFAPLLPISKIDPDNELLISRLNDVDGKYLLGGTQSYLSNPISEVYAGGLINPHARRTFSFNQVNVFDLGVITDGLNFKTNLSFDFFSEYKQAVRNEYSIYEPIWDDNDSIVGLIQYGIDQRTGTQSVSEASYARKLGGYAMFDYDRDFDGLHRIAGSLIGFGTLETGYQDLQGTKNLNFGLRGNYSFKNKYLVDLSSALTFSSKLHESQRMSFSPSLGLAWIISSESFMKPIKNIDYLKLRLTGGMISTDKGISAHFLYNTQTGQSGSYYWYEREWVNRGTVGVRGENLNLDFEKRKDINLGAEGLLFNEQIHFDINCFYHLYDNQLVRPMISYPSFYNQFIPYENFGKTLFFGTESGLTYVKKIREIVFSLGVNALFSTSEVLKRGEIYKNDYQYRTGHPSDAIFGLKADGLFQNEDEIYNHALQTFGSVQPGDIKYVDQNNDHVIDNEDEVVIGRSQPPFTYGLHLNIEWRDITFFISGNGQNGAQAYKSGDYYWVDGNDKYSEVVLDRWTETTKTTARYPRLSSVANNNNFSYSSFWLYDTDYFMIDRVQLTYNIPEKIASKFHTKKIKVYVDGNSLLRFSKNRKIQDLNLSGTPYQRSFSLGINVTF